MTDDNSYRCYPVSLRRQVCKLLDANPLLTAKTLAILLKLPYKPYKQTLTNYRNFWKYNHESERGSKCSSLHCFKAKVKLERQLSDRLRLIVDNGLGKEPFFLGWRLSRARNRFLIWEGRLGRVVWFGSGTVTLHVKKPGNLGRAKQLFCDAFGNTGLVTDVKVLCGVADRVFQKGVHVPYGTKQRLPQLEIKDFVESHGILIKLGDRSHPNAVEVIAEFTAAQERMMEFIENFNGVLKGGVAEPERLKPLEGDYSR